MNKDVEERLVRLRAVLEADPSGVVAGDLPPGHRGDLSGVWEPYAEFLRIADGATLGTVDLYGAEELPRNVWVAEDLPGGAEQWLVIGQLTYEPLGMRRDGTVTAFPPHLDPEPFGQLEDFLLHITGPGYATLFERANRTPWWEVLKLANLVP